MDKKRLFSILLVVFIDVLAKIYKHPVVIELREQKAAPVPVAISD